MNMVDQIVYLEKSIDLQGSMIHTLEQTIKLIDGLVYWKDLDGIYIGCNINFLNYLIQCDKISSSETSIIGKTDYDLFPNNMANNYRKNDLNVINTKKELVAREVNINDLPTNYYLSFKYPLFDRQDNICGIIGNTINFSSIKINSVEVFLTEREIETYACLFFGMSAKEAGMQIGISSKTVETYIQSIKKKLKIPSRKELVSAALNNNLHKIFKYILDI